MSLSHFFKSAMTIFAEVPVQKIINGVDFERETLLQKSGDFNFCKVKLSMRVNEYVIKSGFNVFIANIRGRFLFQFTLSFDMKLIQVRKNEKIN